MAPSKDDPEQYLRAREGECELGTLAIGKTVSGTDFGHRMGAVVADSPRNRLSTRSMWRATGWVNVNLELSRSGNGVRNGFRRPDGRGSGTVRGIRSRHALCGAQPLATAALGVSQALSFFDPAIINLPSLENCERIVSLKVGWSCDVTIDPYARSICGGARNASNGTNS
jgi:hypothetical protein